MKSPPRCILVAGGVMLTLASWTVQLGCQRSAGYYVHRGDRYLAGGKYSDASINYRKAIQVDPKSAEAHYGLGLVAEKQGSENAAYQELRRAVELAPERDDIRVHLADACLRGYQASPNKPKVLYDQVAEAASRLLRKNPRSFDGLRLRADVLSLDRRYDAALAVYRRANALRPREPSVVLPMVQVLFLLNQSGEGEDLAKTCLESHKQFGPLYDVLIEHYTQAQRTGDAEAELKAKVANMPADAGAVVQLASFYWRQQREPDMSRTLLRLLNDPKNFRLGRAIRGDFYAGIGKQDEALREYQAGLASAGKYMAAYRKRIAKVLIGQGKPEEAIGQLDQVLKANPDDLDSREERAILLRDSNDPAKLDLAISELNALTTQAPKDEVVRYNLGLAYFKKGDVKAGRAQLSESANLRKDYIAPRIGLAEAAQKEGDYAETIRIANEILASDPGNADGKLWHAAGLIGSKSYAEARNELNALLQQYPDSRNVNLHMAVLETAEKRFQEAEKRYRKFYKPGDQDLRPLEGLVQVYLAENQFSKAQSLLEQNLAADPGSRPVHLLLGRIAMRAGKRELALQQFDWLRSNNPNAVDSYTALASLYQSQGDQAKALENYKKALRLAPNDPQIIAVVAFLETVSGQQQAAIENLKKQLALDPGNVIAMNNLAYQLAEAGKDLDQALTLAQNAQRQAPNNPGITDTVGWVYVKKGLNDSAIQIFRGLVKKYPDAPEIRYHLGVALLQKGEPAAAKTELLIGLSKKPPKDMADKMKQIIAKMS